MCTISQPQFKSLSSFVIKNMVLFLYSTAISVSDTRHVTNTRIKSTLDCDIYCQTEHLIGASMAKQNINIFYCNERVLIASVLGSSL